MIRALSALAVGLALLVPARPSAATSAESSTREITIPAGTLLPIDLETSVGSDISRIDCCNGWDKSQIWIH